MKMFLTRLGFNSKAVITGDITQIDLPAGRRSGLVEAIEVVGKIEGIAFVHFNERDVVRHNLVQQIIKAYDEFGSTQPQRAKSSGTGNVLSPHGGDTAGAMAMGPKQAGAITSDPMNPDTTNPDLANPSAPK
jgi:hypothetical protein